ncbi:hypothetical protein VB151_17945 [Xanthomonas fragariae]|uniref:Uncharacterized protein n=1 Tax=Xanthomonas fragariae TaxID=48664 RepID=A0A1Y6HN89_9XANT|nr:hypothetical protein [Xanthomonas fragariae]MDM7573596.1 hypothetical protein [Xanthomonas fragariae]MEA5220713.1 hypothetical protein [Xanthomonas fragariae]MEA5250545.1 hypothetical protein [Xanthomonas fragariae]SMR03302.1 hypothetical protein PD5205_01999 [Xanthomonas fragariae]
MRNGLEPPERALVVVTVLVLLAIFLVRDLRPLVDYLEARVATGV